MNVGRCRTRLACGTQEKNVSTKWIKRSIWGMFGGQDGSIMAVKILGGEFSGVGNMTGGLNGRVLVLLNSKLGVTAAGLVPVFIAMSSGRCHGKASSRSMTLSVMRPLSKPSGNVVAAPPGAVLA